ncbi:putative toxin-antitoxin system toxin component, PIN family [Fibrisoma montanum]|uniref:Putative toxin-antitoxin system toxin component, PIN family n=1 Tax=Fibrisoma montanum TaxID=2305895 RepID=A0A418M2Q7_9BACT|nr:putative toxin-antitoxin system toxin component, PIN family [Fibrisoma montanum]RIV19917.1 putative toxin-antitoxin system toxin component, PIN family [Fibrisoma montanum]
MQKVILDTNVIVSALISNSIPTRILYELVLTKKVETCLSDEVFAEYIEVLNREKFARFANFKAKAEVVLNKMREISTFYKTDRKVDVLTDTSDNKFLELAAVSAADFLTTGNMLDFAMTEFEYTRILTPRDYWDNYAPKE